MAGREYPPIPNWKPRIPIVRQPDYNAYSVNNDPLPTTMFTLPSYTAIPTINWQSNIASISSEISSMFSSVPVQRNPAAATESVNFESKGKPTSGIVIGVVSAIAVLALICLGAGILLFICRRNRKRRAAAQGQGVTREMAQNASRSTVAETRAYIGPPSSEPPPSINSPSTMTSFNTHQTNLPQPPVLLSTTMDQSYFTGIDTSDNMSISDNRRFSAASPPYSASLLEAPPPPYRPRSVLSREGSMRLSAPPPSYGPRLSVRSTSNNAVRSPFDDPEEEESPVEQPPSPIDATAEGPQIRDMEEMSEVSELSYQEEPTEPRSSV